MQYCVLTVQMEKRISYLKEKTNVDCDQNELDHDIIIIFFFFGQIVHPYQKHQGKEW